MPDAVRRALATGGLSLIATPKKPINVLSRDIPSTAESQIADDLNEAIAILEEALRSKPVPWLPPWRNRAKEFLAGLTNR